MIVSASAVCSHKGQLAGHLLWEGFFCCLALRSLAASCWAWVAASCVLSRPACWPGLQHLASSRGRLVGLGCSILRSLAASLLARVAPSRVLSRPACWPVLQHLAFLPRPACWSGYGRHESSMLTLPHWADLFQLSTSYEIKYTYLAMPLRSPPAILFTC